MRLHFLGAAMMVTGSSYLMEVGEDKFLVDCGMFQGSKAISALNHRDFLFDPNGINGVLLTHAHIDHSGLLPKLCKAGFKGKIYTTKVTAELSNIMLPDSAHIQQFDAEIANRKGLRAGREPVEPLYTIEDAYNCLKQFAPVDYDTKISLSSQVAVTFRDAGHILGSAILEVWVTEEEKPIKLVFSGDLGQPNQPIIKDPTIIEAADYIITESTYGNRRHDQYDKKEMLAKIINETVDRGGNVIIPSFAVGRTQTLLYYLHELLKEGKIADVPVIIDSPLAISATDIFMHNPQEYDKEAYEMMVKDHENPLKLPQLIFTKTSEESKRLNNLDRPAIIISASGMADAGRILHHLKHNLWRREASVLFVGYQAEGSLGRRLLDGEKHVRVMGEDISVKAHIHNMDGFSAHADQAQLLDWLGHFTTKPANVFIIHGEVSASQPFAVLLQEKLGLSSYIPRYGDAATLNGREWQVEASSITITVSAVQQLHDYLSQLEKEYAVQRKVLENSVQEDARKMPIIIQQLEKIQNFIKKIFVKTQN